MSTDTVSDERAPFFVTKMAPVNDLEDPAPSVMVKNGSNNRSPSRAAAVAITTMLGITGITATAFTFRQHFINSSSISNKIEKDVLGELVELSVGNSQCIVATGTFNHKISKESGDRNCNDNWVLNPFQTCYQYANNDAKYCWTTSVYHDSCNKACKPVDSSTDGGWHFVPWYYVNPHQTCGEPCTEFEKNTYVHPSAISSFD